MESPLDCTSANFERNALSRFRSLVSYFPQEIKVFREPWGNSTVLCLDYENCPHLCSDLQAQADLLTEAITQLGLANSVIFRIGTKTVGWKRIEEG